MGVVTVDGSPRKVNVSGSPYGRVSIQVDGATVYDKKPFMQEKGIDFNLLPGRPAKMKWHQVSLTRRECDITVDNRTTTLAAMAKDGSARAVVGEETRKIFSVRMSGLGMLAVAAFCFWWNYGDLQAKGVYYPKALSIIPLLAAGGFLSLLRPKLILSPESKKLVWVTMIVTGVLLVFGFTVFTHWFLATFAKA